VFDFRYHALSLVAVFLALAVGVLLGVAIGDAGLVSSAKRDIESSLRADVKSSRDQSAELQAEVDRRNDYERQTYPDLVAGRLAGEQIGLIFLGPADDGIVDEVREALEPAGATLRWVGVVREPPDIQGLADRATGSRYVAMSVNPDLLGPFAERMGGQLVTSGKLIAQERPVLMRSFSGDLGVLDGVVVVRSNSRPQESDDQKGTTDTLENGLVSGLNRTTVPVVGVEQLDTDPSQISWYRNRGLASVDSIDEISGRAALVFALAGADGAFGLKSSAEALLPRVVGGISRP
jgi:copper transport outer membrane protein MctB